jgi:glyoxylase-like metal-dependent hydrolase (beta-lactamase superfamily II)
MDRGGNMSAMSDAPRVNTATYHVLTAGYYERGVASTVGLIRDGAVLVVVDPGMVRDRALILDPLAALGVQPHEVTDVVFSHHHPDHTINAALFPAARYHDHWAIYENDVWTSRDAEGFELSPSIKLIRTPGHSPQDITTLAQTSDGIAAFTHVWWNGEAPVEDPYADMEQLHASRARVLAVADIAIPGHGPAFAPSEATPR